MESIIGRKRSIFLKGDNSVFLESKLGKKMNETIALIV